MIYLGHKYVYEPNEMLWFVAGLIIGVMVMAVIDFVIDRAKK
jgi:hypothetical protein